MIISTIPEFIYFACAMVGAAYLGHRFQQFVNPESKP